MLAVLKVCLDLVDMPGKLEAWGVVGNRRANEKAGAEHDYVWS
jgi:hypothetical protein